MYQKILVAVDGSQCAAKALDEAIKLAAAFDAELEIVHIVDPGYEEEGVRARLVAGIRNPTSPFSSLTSSSSAVSPGIVR